MTVIWPRTAFLLTNSTRLFLRLGAEAVEGLDGPGGRVQGRIGIGCASHFLSGFIANIAAVFNVKRLHFRAVGHWHLEPDILLNIDDVRGDVAEGSVLHFGVLLGPLVVHIRRLVVEEGLHRGFLAVVGVQTLD